MLTTAHDRALLDAADRHLARTCRCAQCERAIDADTAPAASAAVADHLGVAVDALLCEGCDRDARADLDAELAADPDFVTVCDARRDGVIASMEAAAARCALCPGEMFVRTFEPTIVDPCDVENLRHAVALRHGRRVLATGTPLCACCVGLISYLPAIDTAVAA